MSRFAIVAVCSTCLKVAGEDPHDHKSKFRHLCQECGMDPGDWMSRWGNSGTGHWKHQRREWTSEAKWYAPWTWFTGRWTELVALRGSPTETPPPSETGDE